MKVRAAVLREMGKSAPYADSKPLSIETVMLAAPGIGELRVRVLAAGLCHSDLSVIDGSRPRPLPMVLGHEATGEVVELGANVRDFCVGDRVVFSFVPMCGHCTPCASGRPVLCEPGAAANAQGRLLTGDSHFAGADSTPLLQHLGVSGFAEYTVVSARSAVRIDGDLPAEIAALFGCAVMTGVGAVINTAHVQSGESVAVFGLGGVGLSSLLGAHATSAYPLIAIDVIEEKLELARALGQLADARILRTGLDVQLDDVAGVVVQRGLDGMDAAQQFGAHRGPVSGARAGRSRPEGAHCDR